MEQEKGTNLDGQTNEGKPVGSGGQSGRANTIFWYALLIMSLIFFGWQVTGFCRMLLHNSVSVGEKVTIVDDLCSVEPQNAEAGAVSKTGRCWLSPGGTMIALKIEGDLVLTEYKAPLNQVKNSVFTKCPDGLRAVVDKSDFRYWKYLAAAKADKQRAARDRAEAERKLLEK